MPSATNAPQPLFWPVNWDELTSWQRLLIGIPFVGSQSKARKGIRVQLAKRTAACLELWKSYSSHEQEVANGLAVYIRDALGWPNKFFIPDDPFEIMIWDYHGDLATPEVLLGIERCLGLKKKETLEWEILSKKKFGEIVCVLSKEGAARNQ